MCSKRPKSIVHSWAFAHHIQSKGTYLVQTKDLVQTCANLLKKVSKNSEKIMNVLLNLPHLYTKFYGQIHLTLKVTKKDKISDNNNGSNASQICLFCNF